jgi:NhaP-type Na+/H+ or K+/H+ antiporter
MQPVTTLSLWGSGAFGLVIGWIAYRTLRRTADAPRLADLVTVIAALGGGAVINARFAEPDLFAAYGIGLAAGFFAYLVVAYLMERSDRKADARTTQPGASAAQSPAEAAGRTTAASRPANWMGDV